MTSRRLSASLRRAGRTLTPEGYLALLGLGCSIASLILFFT